MSTSTGVRNQRLGIGLSVAALMLSGSVSAVRMPAQHAWFCPDVSVGIGTLPGTLRLDTSTGQSSVFASAVFARAAEDQRLSIADLRDLSGLTASQVARLFGVSRRSVNHWLAGKAMAVQHEERLSLLLAMVQSLSGTSPDERRGELLDSSGGPSLFHQMLTEAPRESVLQSNPLDPSEQF